MKVRLKTCGIIIIVLVCVLSGYKFIQHEKSQNEKINNLLYELEYVKAELDASDVEWKGDTYNYLAIGNSITVHGINDYWWNEVGMAATKLENDYVHQTESMLKDKLNQDITVYSYNFSAWEVNGYDRSECLSFLDGYLNEKINLITIQLSENASDLKTFESDFEEMLSYIQKKTPSAQIIVIGDFWDKAEKDNMKIKACSNCGIKFLSLDEIKENKNYQCGVGTVVFDDKGQTHTVQHQGVAIHPNDKAMKWIAEQIVEQVEK